MIIIPDVHGRPFWEKPVNDNLDKEHILFLGDYLDPYEYEHITCNEAYDRFLKIIDIKKEHPDTVTLLLGNHDLHYVNSSLMGSRYDYANAYRNLKLILGNADVFQMSYIHSIGDRKMLFTHAGLTRGWIDMHYECFEGMSVAEMAVTMNIMWSKEEYRQGLLRILSDISRARWGDKPFGSPIWNDIDDMADDADELPGWYQIFGHSQQEFEPVIGKHFACLDCRRAFRLTEDCTIEELEKRRITFEDAERAATRVMELKNLIDKGFIQESDIPQEELRQLAKILNEYTRQKNAESNTDV